MCRYRHNGEEQILNDFLKALEIVRNILSLHAGDLDKHDKAIDDLKKMIKSISKKGGK